jgi:PKD repeat protein
MKETYLPVVVDFEYVNESEYNTSPLIITLENKTTGADFFEWTFEGGSPSESKEKNPGKVTFTKPGEHKITLRARNLNLEAFKEVVVRVDSVVTVNFDYQILVNDFAPAQVSIVNRTKGASSYEWVFEGGEPATSTLAAPGTILFANGGEHKVTLTVSNGSQSFTAERSFTLKASLLCDFTITPAITNDDWEAPVTAILKNTSRSSLSVIWQCDGGVIADATAEETTIYFARPGTYIVTLKVDNLKEQKSKQQQITVLPNSGIYTIRNLRFGINQARNTVGCFFSSDLKRVLKSNEIVSPEIGAGIDIGFFALNSTFEHCYFFSPNKAFEAAFAVIPNAIETQVNNVNTNNITQTKFEQIVKADDLNIYNFAPGTGTGSGNFSDYFTLEELPVFVVFKTQDGRRGIIMIKNAVRIGAESYMVADIKIEKRIK